MLLFMVVTQYLSDKRERGEPICCPGASGHRVTPGGDADA